MARYNHCRLEASRVNKHMPLVSWKVTLALGGLWWILALHAIASVDAAQFGFQMPKEDPYKVLGISNKDRNNINAIKKAYRQKAKDHHPDKNLNMDPQEANAKFHRINEAWEFLSNAQNKRTYDQRNQGGNRGPSSWQFQHNQRTRSPTQQRQAGQAFWRQQQERNRKIKEEQERQRRAAEAERAKLVRMARVAQENIVRFSTLEQLQERKDLFDMETKTFRKHFLCVFVGDRNVEHIADNDFLFPYPFGSDWTDIFVFAKVRYNKATPLTRVFRAPLRVTKPYIVFAKKGSRLDFADFHVFQPYRQPSHFKIEEFEKWVLEHLKTKITIVNRFAEGGPSLKVFFGSTDEKKKLLKSAGKAIPPGYMLEVPASISDRFIVVNGNLDSFLGSIGVDEHQSLLNDPEVIERVAMHIITVREEDQRFDLKETNTRQCYDLSVRCNSWAGKNDQCSTHSVFSHSMCPKSCGVCLESHYWSGVYYTLTHLPISKVPDFPGARQALIGIRTLVSFVKMGSTDFGFLWRSPTVLFFLIASGFLSGVQIVLWARTILGSPNGCMNSNHSSPDHYKLASLARTLVAPSLQIISRLVFSQRFMDAPHFLLGFIKDLEFLEYSSKDFIAALYGLGAVSFLLSMVLCKGRNQILLLGLSVALSVLLLLATNFYLIPDSGIVRVRWNGLWAYRKNVAVALLVSGLFAGAAIWELARFARAQSQRLVSNRMGYFILSILNLSLLGILLISSEALDGSFDLALEHTLAMRMSAGIPCIVVGMVMGLTCAHFASKSHRGKVKVD